MLTDQQQAFFDVFGFVVWKEAFSSDEISTITGLFDEVLEQDRQGREFSGEKRQGVLGFLEQREDLYRLVEDDRIYRSVTQLLGPDFIWIGSDGNLYVGDTQWHPDNPQLYRRLKVAFYLDPVGKDTGALRVIPGSHLPGLAERLKERPPRGGATESPYGVDGPDIPCFPLESQPGDVVFFNQALYHASYGGKTGRRMFTLNFGAKPKADADYENLKTTYQGNLRNVRDLGLTKKDRIYTDAFLHSDSPRIQSMVAEVLEMGLR